jgi:hypothetical protein
MYMKSITYVVCITSTFILRASLPRGVSKSEWVRERKKKLWVNTEHTMCYGAIVVKQYTKCHYNEN